MTEPRIGSLCSGYGGLEMGLQLAVGGTVAWHAEYDDAPAAILAHHWPDVPNLRDITAVDWADVEPVDWLTAGYPCQPFSLAGKRKGADDERHLWPYVAAAIGVLRPRRVLLENVAGHVTLGLGTVLGDLAEMGYDATWGVVRASDTGAAHRRTRVFILAADTADDGHERRGSARGRRSGSTNGCVTSADPDSNGLQGIRRVDAVGRERVHELGGTPAVLAWGPYGPAIGRWERVLGRAAPGATEPGRSGARLNPAFVEWMMGLPAGHVTAVPGLTRHAQLKALGNGVVPQQAALAVKLLLGQADLAVAS